MKIALTSMDIEWEDKSVNREKCVELIKRASEQEARLILFPEMTLTGFTMKTEEFGEDAPAGNLPETVGFFMEQSKKFHIAVGFGYIRNEANRSSNHFVVVDQDEILGDYTKIHPFSFGGESYFYRAGYRLVSVSLDGVKIGLFICYDLRFPEIFQKSCEENTVFAVIANWPKNRIRHWDCLLSARAVETQSIVLGVNRKGSGGGVEYESSSRAYDFDGVLLDSECSVTNLGDECILVEVRPEFVRDRRREFPVRKDRRKQLYRSFYEE